MDDDEEWNEEAEVTEKEPEKAGDKPAKEELEAKADADDAKPDDDEAGDFDFDFD